jgi:hypothetical protein
MLFHNELSDSFDKAAAASNKHASAFSFGRSKKKKQQQSSDAANGITMGPRGQDSIEHWTKTVQLRGPWASQTRDMLTQDLYAAHPGVIASQNGAAGVCAAGTCGGSTGCGTGAVTLCRAGCTGVSPPFP